MPIVPARRWRLWKTIARKTLPAGMSYEWTAMSYQEKLAGNSTWFIFALALLLVYFVSSWTIRKLDNARRR